MSDSEEIMEQIKTLCSSATKDTYDTVISQGYELLSMLCNLSVEKEEVYQLLLQYHDSMDDSLCRDCVADLLDYAVGWCAPDKYIWKGKVLSGSSGGIES